MEPAECSLPPARSLAAVQIRAGEWSCRPAAVLRGGSATAHRSGVSKSLVSGPQPLAPLLLREDLGTKLLCKCRLLSELGAWAPAQERVRCRPADWQSTHSQQHLFLQAVHIRTCIGAHNKIHSTHRWWEGKRDHWLPGLSCAQASPRWQPGWPASEQLVKGPVLQALEQGSPAF